MPSPRLRHQQVQSPTSAVAVTRPWDVKEKQKTREGRTPVEQTVRADSALLTQASGLAVYLTV